MVVTENAVVKMESLNSDGINVVLEVGANGHIYRMRKLYTWAELEVDEDDIEAIKRSWMDC